ncbi:MAG: hypothetical protein FWH19_04595 [Treponema sp.]|nr:hypothetical protein [Treponema sp.]
MAEASDYTKALGDALKARAGWLEQSELPKLKESLRLFHTGFASLYNLFIKKRLINEDPYKAEAKIGELEVPKSTPFASESEKMDQLSQRLANYDNQLDFLVNFYQFSPEFLTLDRIKRILGLVKYIDWVSLSPDSQSIMTKAAAEMTNQIKIGSDPLTMSLISESLSNLNKTISPIMAQLKNLSDYQREHFKLDVRDATAGMSQAEVSNIALVKKKFAQYKPSAPFFAELVEEAIREDFTKEGPALRNEVLKKLQVAENKPKIEKAQVSFKGILIEGIQTLGSSAGTLGEMLVKLDFNQALLENKKKSFAEKIKLLLQQAFNKEPDPIIYDLEYIDPVKSIPVKEKVNFNIFRGELDKKVRTLTPMGPRSGSAGKMEAMQEDQLLGFLDRTVRELQNLHKILGAMDDFFKTEVDRVDRDKIRGIKPELGTIKNTLLKANAKRHEYNAQKEEEEQLKRLGVNPVA